MPHRIDIDGLHQNLFILQNLCFGSKLFCKTHNINRLDESTEYEWYFHLSWLKSLVCEKLIDSSIKIRIIQDFLREYDNTIDFFKIDKEVSSDIIIGEYKNNPTILTIREACNKIIHALEIRLQWQEVGRKSKNRNPVEYWNGNVELEGKKGKEKWKVLIHTQKLCVAMERVIAYLENNIDWNHIYKYDE